MPTVTHNFEPILVKRMRATSLTDGGAIDASSKYIVTDGLISIKLSAQIDDGAEILQRNAAGYLCVNEKLNPAFKRINLDIDFCGVNPTLLAWLTSAKEYADYAGDIAGFTQGEGMYGGKFALDWWTGLTGHIGDDAASGYSLLPHVHQGNIGDVEFVGDKQVDFTLTGAYTVGNNQWGVGPYDVLVNNDSPGVPDVLPTALDPLDHWLLVDTAVPAPALSLSPMPVLP